MEAFVDLLVGNTVSVGFDVSDSVVLDIATGQSGTVVIEGGGSGTPDEFLLARGNHTGTQSITTLGDMTEIGRTLAAAADAAAARTALSIPDPALIVRTTDPRLVDERIPRNGSVTSAKLADSATQSFTAAIARMVNG